MISREVLTRIQQDPRYVAGLDWGEARVGHPEGRIRDHIGQLERNFQAVSDLIPPRLHIPIELLIHTHDSFKHLSQPKADVESERNHAAIAAKFLSEFTDSSDLVAIARSHDVPFVAWSDYAYRGEDPERRWKPLFARISDLELLAAFNIIDGLTEGKHSEPVRWALERIYRERSLPQYLARSFDRLKSTARDQREVNSDLIPLQHIARFEELRFNALGPVAQWGADIALSRGSADTAKDCLVETARRRGCRFQLVIEEAVDSHRLHFGRYPSRSDEKVPSLTVCRTSFAAAYTALADRGIPTWRGGEEGHPIEGGLLRVTMEAPAAALPRIMSVFEASAVTVQPGLILTVRENGSTAETACAVLNGKGRQARLEMYRAGLSLGYRKLLVESLTARESSLIELRDVVS